MIEKKINVGVIGVGYWGPNLIRNFVKNEKSIVLKVCDLKDGRLEYIKNLYPDISTTKIPDEIINDEDIDAAIIATPVNTHYELGIKCLNKNKHVFIEKPFTDNYSDGFKLVEHAKIQNKILAVGHIFQFAPAVTALKRSIESGLSGKLFHFSSRRINLGPPKTTVDVIWDLAPHDLSILLHIFNEYPTEIIAHGNSYWWKGIIDNAHIFLKFASCRTAHIYVSWLSSNKTREILLMGENGNYVYDEIKRSEDKLTFYDRGIDNRIGAKDSDVKNLQYGTGEIRKIEVENIEPLYAEIDAFLEAILVNKAPVNDGNIGCEVVKILEEASKSIKR